MKGQKMVSCFMENLKQIGGGVTCKVFDVGDGIVYKKFENEEITRKNFLLQQFFNKHGLAPNVIAVDVEGYYSEKVKIHMDYDWKHHIRFDVLGRKISCRLQRLFGFTFPDSHRGNIGIKGCHAVIIDFDSFYWSEDMWDKIVEMMNVDS